MKYNIKYAKKKPKGTTIKEQKKHKNTPQKVHL